VVLRMSFKESVCAEVWHITTLPFMKINEGRKYKNISSRDLFNAFKDKEII
jgi:hypothetical protein